MKALMYSNRKEDAIYWDISTPEKEIAGIKCLFNHLNEVWELFNYNHEFYHAAQLKELEDLKVLLDENKIPEILVKETKEKLERLLYLRHMYDNYKEEKELSKLAKAGDIKAIKKLLRDIQGCEYSDWRIINVIDPLA